MSTRHIFNSTLSQKEFQTIADALPAGLVKILATDYSLLYANNEYFKILGYTREEYLKKFGNKVLQTVHPQDRVRVIEAAEHTIRTKSAFSREYQVLDSYNETKSLYVKSLPLDQTEDGNDYFLALVLDITDKVNIENSLQLWKKRAYKITALIGEQIWEFDIETHTIQRFGNILSSKKTMDNECFEFFHFTRDSLPVHPDEKDIFDLFCRELENGRRNLRLEYRVKNESGNYVWVCSHGIAIKDEHNSVCKILGKTELLDKPEFNNPTISSKLTVDALSDIIQDAMEEKRDELPVALIMMSMDTQDKIRDSYGDALCDSIMEDTLTLIRSKFPQAICEWMENNCFLLYFPSIEDENVLASNALSIQRLANSVHTGSNLSDITFSMGMSIASSSNCRFETLNKKAELSLTAAITKGPGCWDIYGYSARNLENNIKAKAKPSILPDYKIGKDFGLFNQIISACNSGFITDEIIESFLKRICEQYNADFCYVAQRDLLNQSYGVTHRWRAPYVRHNASLLEEFRIESVSDYESHFDENGLFICDNINVLADNSSMLMETLTGTGISSFLATQLHEKGQVIGHISLAFVNPDIPLDHAQMQSFLFLARAMDILLVSKKKQLEWQKTNSDNITGLYNLNTFIQEANQLLRLHKEKHYALIYSDINKFKGYNINYGFAIGNLILKKYADFLGKITEPDELVSRIEKDHFLSLFHYETINDLYERLSSRMISEQSEDFYRFDCIYGIYLIQPEDTDVSLLIDRANQARQSIKGFSGNHYNFYKPKKEKVPQTDHAQLENDIGHAFKHHEFVPYIQAQYDINGLVPVSGEVLVRWKHPNGTVYLPEDFLPLTDEQNITANLDLEMLRAGCRHLKRRLSKGVSVLPLSFNLSSAHVLNTDTIRLLKEIPEKYEVPSNLITFELSEVIFVDYPEQTRYLISELHSLGFRMLLDDFGNTYSSLQILGNFDIDGLKLDTGFVRPRLNSQKDRVIFAKIIDMAKELGLTVYTEGVETLSQYNFLRSCGCDIVQGFLYAKPMDVDSFETFLLGNH